MISKNKSTMSRKEFIKKMGQMAYAVPLLPYINIIEEQPKQNDGNMKKIIDITRKNLNIFEFVDTDKEISCTESIFIGEEIMPHNSDVVFLKDNFLVRNTENIDLPHRPPFWHISTFTDGDNTMQVIFEDVSRHRYFKNFPFIQGFFKLQKKHLIKDPFTEKTIHYPKITIKGKDIPFEKYMKDF